jgi:TolB-like protein/Tfp pilus assembly protein PilF/class 3 adenylate cyclase
MSSASSSDVKLEIGHVLFIDIVGYSKLLITEQSGLLQKLKEIVRGTEQFRLAEAEGKLLRLPTGDGGALVFRTGPEAPVLCAMEIAKALKDFPKLRVRMGIHSGPVNEISDLNEQANIAGAGINMAQRVMDCGDAGHILLSRHVAEDLEQYPRWQPHLHDLGECEVKHGVRMSVVNLCTDDVGNRDVPEKLRQARVMQAAPAITISRGLLAALIIAAAAVAGLYIFSHRSGPTAPPSATTPAPVAIPEKSIAVLPFENLSEEKANAFFADGVQDEILTDLAKIADLKVISRTSVMPYKSGLARNLRKIGEELGVAHVLEGSVQRAANKIRVNAQLIDARNDAHLWAQTYDRDLADVFAIQSEIAKAIADQLQAKILPQEQREIEKPPTKDVAAYDLYARARTELYIAPSSDQPKEHFVAAVNLLEQAVARDPGFVEAYCRLGEAHDRLYVFGLDHTPQRLALAEEAIKTALQLQPDSPEAHLALAGHLYSKLDYDGARAEIAIVHRTLPNNARAYELSGYIDRRQGRWAESTHNLERAIELDPNNTLTLQQTATTYELLGNYSREAAILDRVISLEPNNFNARIGRAQMEVSWKADPRPLHELIASAIRENPASARGLATIRVYLAFAERDPAGGLQALADLGENTFGPDAIQFPPAVGEAVFARLKGDAAAAQMSFTQARATQEKIVASQPDYGPALCVLATIDAGLGRKDDALRESARALALMPVTKDSINGAHITRLSAMIYSWVGENDLALDELKRAVQTPGGADYGYLKLFPQWDPLRGDPRFEKIVASLAPKE